jgi:hypothetical protein
MNTYLSPVTIILQFSPLLLSFLPMSLTTSQAVGGFGLLPAEIIQKIAMSLSCLEAIALSLTCRNAYAAVSDWLVFAELIRLGLEGRDKRISEVARVLPWTVPEHAYALASSSVGRAEVYKRYALANETANEVPYVIHSEALRIGQWIPMLQLCHRKYYSELSFHVLPRR